MTIDQLRQFVAVAKHLNFSRGAEEMFLHQSTVSKNIAALESEMGGSLFIRKKNDLRLTNAGMLLYNEAPQLIEKFDSLQKRTMNIMSGTSGNIHIISANGYASALTPTYKEFTSLYPNIELDMTEVHQPFTFDLFQSVFEGSHDLAVVPTGELPAGDENLERRPIYRDTFVVLMSPTHPLYGKEEVAVNDLSGETVLMLKYMKLMPIQLMENALFLGGIPGLTVKFIDANMSQQPPSYLLLQVMSGQGITILPRNSAIVAGWAGKLTAISDLFLPFDISIIWRRNNINPSLQLFTDIVEKHIPHL